MTYEEENAAFEAGVKLGVEIAITLLASTVYEHADVAVKHPELFLGKVRKTVADALSMREIGLQAMDGM